MFLLLGACVSLECGPGTKQIDASCVVDLTDGGPFGDDSADDSAPVDSSPDTDGSDSADSADSADSGADTAEPAEEVLQVYILAGQSNMDGYAYLSGLPPEQRVADPRVPLYWSGWGAFRDLAPSSYGGSMYVGPEVPLGSALADAGVPVVLVKHAVGGTDLASYWYPGTTPNGDGVGPGFSVLAATMEAAATELDAGGRPWEWAGFMWMQGESDSLDAGAAAAYEDNLSWLLSSVRALADDPQLPAAIGLISRESIWTYADTVRAAQQAVADADPDVVTVETDDLPRNALDLAHYDGPSNRVLGARFARAVITGEDVPADADAPLAAFTITGGALDYDFTGTCGFAFTLDAPISVTDLGSYGATYLYTSTEVGIWDAAANLVARAYVPSWYEAPASWRGSVWYTAIDPVRLDPGTYRIGVVSWTGDGDRYLNSVSGSFARGLVYAGGVYAEGYWLTYPSVSAGDAVINFLGPDFLFVPAE